MKKQLIILVTLLIAGYGRSWGQQVSINAISSGGGYTECPSGSNSWTVGQFVFVTQQDANGALTQGFQQPELRQCPPAGMACDDGDACTENDLEDGLCTCAGTPINCDDGDPNTIDSCVPATGECRNFNPIPTLSEWGLIVFALLLLCVGTIAVWNDRYGAIYAKQSV